MQYIHDHDKVIAKAAVFFEWYSSLGVLGFGQAYTGGGQAVERIDIGVLPGGFRLRAASENAAPQGLRKLAFLLYASGLKHWFYLRLLLFNI